MVAVTRHSKRLALAAATALSVAWVGAARAQVVGFGGTTETGWTPNFAGTAPTPAVPNVSGTGTSADVLTLTTAANGQASSYWYNTPQGVTNFTESFTYQDVSKNGADGFAVVWQNAGTNALGGGGGSLGYSGIASAAALAGNVYSGAGGSSTGYVGTIASTGSSPTVVPTLGGVNLDLGNPVNFTLSYRGADGALTEKATDTVTNATYTRVYRGISIEGQVGGTSAYVGFTAGTGGISAQQTVTNFQFTAGAAAPTPVATIKPIAATGWNQNMIVSVGGNNLTATMDQGTASTTAATFYEQGVRAVDPYTGLPRAGVTFGSETDTAHSYVLQPNGAGQNDAVLLDVAHPTGGLTLGGTTAYSLLSFLVAGGQGSSTFSAVINYADGTSQTASIASPDWFGNTPVAWYAEGRINEGATPGYDNVNAQNPRLYEEDLTLTDLTSAVTSISFTSGASGASNTREVIYGLSGTAVVPEPASVGLLAAAAVGLAARRRRTR